MELNMPSPSMAVSVAVLVPVSLGRCGSGSGPVGPGAGAFFARVVAPAPAAPVLLRGAMPELDVSPWVFSRLGVRKLLARLRGREGEGEGLLFCAFLPAMASSSDVD